MLREAKDKFSTFFSNTTKTTFITLLLTMASLLTLYNMRKTIVVSIDGSESQIITFRRDLKSALLRQNIDVGPKDKISVCLDSKIKDGDKIYIKKAVEVDVVVEGQEMKIHTSEETIGDMLDTEGITLSQLDKVEPLPTEAVSGGMRITITRVETQVVKEYTAIDYATTVKKDNTLLNTVSKVVQEGQTGEKEITLRVIFENGKEIARNIISEVVTKQPTEKVLVQGTLSIINLSRGGRAGSESFSYAPPESLVYKSALRCVATAYSAEEPGMGTKTASGTTVRRNPNGFSTIAVDPRVIPLGTKVFVEGYGYAIAEDTGGAIKGNKIDVYLDTVRDCYNWGVRSVNVYILP